MRIPVKHRADPGLIGVSSERDISAVTAVSLRTSGTVTLTAGAKPGLTITAADALALTVNGSGDLDQG